MLEYPQDLQSDLDASGAEPAPCHAPTRKGHRSLRQCRVICVTPALRNTQSGLSECGEEFGKGFVVPTHSSPQSALPRRHFNETAVGTALCPLGLSVAFRKSGLRSSCTRVRSTKDPTKHRLESDIDKPTSVCQNMPIAAHAIPSAIGR